jgi:hypothetical protein
MFKNICEICNKSTLDEYVTITTNKNCYTFHKKCEEGFLLKANTLVPFTCLVCSKKKFENKYSLSIGCGKDVNLHILCSKACRKIHKKKLLTFIPETVSMEYICGFCEKTNEKQLTCGACKLMYYCDQVCQRKHWKEHKLKCNK